MWSSPTIHSLHSTTRICCTFLQSTVCTARETPLRWVRTSKQGLSISNGSRWHPTGLVKPDDPDAKIKFLAAEALRGVGGLFDALGNFFAYELSRRDYVTGEMGKNKPPFRLALNRAASGEIARH